jgi:hypothetical protein
VGSAGDGGLRGDWLGNILAWIDEGCEGDIVLASTALHYEEKLGEFHRSTYGDMLVGPTTPWVRPFKQAREILDRLIDATSTFQLPVSVYSAMEALAISEQYLALTVPPELLKPWHRYAAVPPVLETLFGMMGRVAITRGMWSIANEFRDASTDGPTGEDGPAVRAIRHLEKAVARDTGRRFQGAEWQPEDETFEMRRFAAAAALDEAFMMERESGWRLRLETVLEL